jgi:hypothetical protein
LEDEIGVGRKQGTKALERRAARDDKGSSVDDLAAFLQSMVGAYDRLLSRGAAGGVERSLLEEWVGQKRKLSAFVTKMVGGVKSSGRRFGDGDGEEDEVDVEWVESEMKDKRWERNPVRARKGPLTKAEQRAERIKRDFPDPRVMRRQQQQQDAQREEGVVVQGWGAAFGDLAKNQQEKSHGMAL